MFIIKSPKHGPGGPSARRQSAGHGVANAAAKRVHQIFFRMAIGREVEPLAPTCAGGSSFGTPPSGARTAGE